MTELILPRRFCGPPHSGNGGYTAGALAAHLHDCPDNRVEAWPPVEVSLRQPPPLEAPMLLAPDEAVEGGVVATFGGAVIATAHTVPDTLVEVPGVDPATARAAEASYAGLVEHPFPTCFSCGTAREEGDGLRIFPGRVDDVEADGLHARVAATWTPHPSLNEDWHTYVDDVPRASLPATWAALDCVGGWAGDLAERAMVLARITARVDTLPVIGEPHVVVGAHRATDGRKTRTASTLHDADGRVVATAEHLWIAVDTEAFAALLDGR
jgi:hypothetical protein